MPIVERCVSDLQLLGEEEEEVELGEAHGLRRVLALRQVHARVPGTDTDNHKALVRESKHIGKDSDSLQEVTPD